MDEGSDRSASLERDAEVYVSQLSGFGAFTLRRFIWPDRPGEPILEADVYRSGDAGEIEELRRLLAARPLGAHCMCIGSALISLEGGPAPVVLSIHHGESVRRHDASSAGFDLACGNFELARGRELAEWLAARGLPDVRDEMNESERRYAQGRAEERAWVAAMPAAVVPYREAILELGRTSFDPSLEVLGQLSEALKNAESDDAQRIRALLRWHAGGSGRCSGYPVYEGVPETLLLGDAPDALLAVVSAPDLTDTELAGAARLVASWGARNRSEFDSLPEAAWDRLTAAAAEGDDDDMGGRLARRRSRKRQRRRDSSP